mmetsp:Transcript_21774/g.65123  ORF Transcript_21774/g.65123 Transcript_21774/m.65123 type:complete len:251 (+) Transcript_21774:1709-2461(+)
MSELGGSTAVPPARLCWAALEAQRVSPRCSGCSTRPREKIQRQALRQGCAKPVVASGAAMVPAAPCLCSGAAADSGQTAPHSEAEAAIDQSPTSGANAGMRPYRHSSVNAGMKPIGTRELKQAWSHICRPWCSMSQQLLVDSERSACTAAATPPGGRRQLAAAPHMPCTMCSLQYSEYPVFLAVQHVRRHTGTCSRRSSARHHTSFRTHSGASRRPHSHACHGAARKVPGWHPRRGPCPVQLSLPSVGGG